MLKSYFSLPPNVYFSLNRHTAHKNEHEPIASIQENTQSLQNVEWQIEVWDTRAAVKKRKNVVAQRGEKGRKGERKTKLR